MRNIHEQAVGRWRSILIALGVNSRYLVNKHGPCPICNGGKDRFRWDDKGGRGTWICNVCGSGAGIDLVMRLKGIDFLDAVKLIEAELPGSVVATPQRRNVIDPTIYKNLWRAAQPLSGSDPASWYLKSRGIDPEVWPNTLRFVPKMTYRHEDGSTQQMPAMLALFVSPDSADMTLHATYLDHLGRKANVPKAKRLAPMPVPKGGAVRLYASAETMGIAEGIETALSASMMHGVPVWAALNDGGLIKWEPPPGVKNVIIYGDNDTSFAGQLAAYSLAYRLRSQRDEGVPRYGSIEVAIYGVHVLRDAIDHDWNDLHKSLTETVKQEAA